MPSSLPPAPVRKDAQRLARRLVALACRGVRPRPTLPLTLVQFQVREGREHTIARVFTEAVLRDPAEQYVHWVEGPRLSVLRAGEELEAMVWADEIRAATQALGIPVSGGVACCDELPRGSHLSDLERLAEAARTKATKLGGSLVVAHSLLAQADRAA